MIKTPGLISNNVDTEKNVKGSLTILAIYAHFSEDQNTVVKLPVLLKYKLGNRLMSYEEIDVRIFILCFLIG